MSTNLKMTIAGLVIAMISIAIFSLTEDMPGHPIRWAIFGIFCVGCFLTAVALWWPKPVRVDPESPDAPA